MSNLPVKHIITITSFAAEDIKFQFPLSTKQALADEDTILENVLSWFAEALIATKIEATLLKQEKESE